MAQEKKYMVVADKQSSEWNYMVGVIKTKSEWQDWLINQRVKDGNEPLIKIARETTYDNIIETISDMYQLTFREVELNKIFLLFDSDISPKHFDEWLYAVFKVPNITDAERFFQGWLNEYFNSEELMNKTNRYSYIYNKAVELGYEVIFFQDCGGFGC